MRLAKITDHARIVSLLALVVGCGDSGSEGGDSGSGMPSGGTTASVTNGGATSTASATAADGTSTATSTSESSGAGGSSTTADGVTGDANTTSLTDGGSAGTTSGSGGDTAAGGAAAGGSGTGGGVASGGASGSGGTAGDECDSLALALDQAMEAARACDPDADVAECVEGETIFDACGCPYLANEAHPDLIIEAEAALDAFSSACEVPAECALVDCLGFVGGGICATEGALEGQCAW